ncbi:MAG: VOC family protein [Xanthobacteraceae bacterium]|nr:VOC family protein [Xanthobacteraceae bacterium]
MKDRPDTWSRPRGLDHIVHVVGDLDNAAELYRRCGFQVSGRNRHPWGTHNCVVQFDNFYIELLTVAEPELIPPHAAHQFSFGAFNRDFLDRGQGLSMVLLKSTDAREDARQFREAAIGDFDVFDFERQGIGPDGKPLILAFSLAFARDVMSPHAGFGTCQHHFPQNFWNAARQVHDNGTRGIGGVILTADNPADHHIFLSSFTGVRLLHSNSIGVRSRTPLGDLEIMEAPSFRDQFGVVPKVVGEGASFAGVRLLVADLTKLEEHLRTTNVAHHRHVGRVVVRSEDAFGATLIFEQSAGH